MQNLACNVELSSDSSVLEKILQGNIDYFEVLIRRYNSILYKIARSYGFNHQDAEDLMQETHISAYLALKNFEGRSSYKTWISRIMVNKCLYKLKTGYYKNEVVTDHSLETNYKPMYSISTKSQPEHRFLNRELNKVLESSLEKVPVMYRIIFVLREIEGFSVAETAELLNITTVNVKVRLNRAKAQLKTQIGQFYSNNEIYSFNLIYCDAIVHKVFERIDRMGNAGSEDMGFEL